MILVPVTMSLLSAFNTLSQKVDKSLSFMDPVLILDGNVMMLVDAYSTVSKHRVFRVDLLWNSSASPVMNEEDLPGRFYDASKTSSQMRENARESASAQLCALMLRATRKAGIDGKQIMQSLQALGFDVSGWKITRNYITDGLLFDVRQETTGDGQDKNEEYVSATLEDFVTDLSRRNLT